jgi:hypothetical protein
MEHQTEFEIMQLVWKIRKSVYRAELLLYTVRFAQANWVIQFHQGDDNGNIWRELLEGWSNLIAIELYGTIFDDNKCPPPLRQLHTMGHRKDTKKIIKNLEKYRKVLRQWRTCAAHPKIPDNWQRSGFYNPLFEIIKLIRKYLEYYKDMDEVHTFQLSSNDKKIIARYLRGCSKSPKKNELDSNFLYPPWHKSR